MEKIALLFMVVVLVSCTTTNTKKEFPLNKIEVVSNPEVNSECVFLGDGIAGEKLLCWTEEREDGNVLVYRKFKKNNFENKITVIPTIGLQSHHESMAKIGVAKNGVLFCLFRIALPTPKNKYGGALYFTTSKDDGETWSKKVKLVNDPSSTSQSFYDLERMETGELAIVWLDNRLSTREKRGSTLFYTNTINGISVAKEKPIAFNTCQCCRTDLLVSKGEVKIAFRNIIEGNIRDMFYITSKDNGRVFTKPERISEDKWEIDGCPHTGPSLGAENNTGVVWFTAGQGNKGLFFSVKENSCDSFNKRIEISEGGNHPQLIAVNGLFYIVYDEYYIKDDTTFQHIKLHKKNTFAVDDIIELSQNDTMNSHPVITTIDQNKILVSWTNLDNDKKRIQSIIVKI